MIVFRKVNVAKGLVVLIISLAVLVLVGSCRPAEPELVESPEVEVVEPIEVQADRTQPQATVSFHDKCAGVLKDFVDDRGMVDYKGLRRERYGLRTVLEEFSKLDRRQYRSWPKADKIAFWINTYNLQKLKVVADNYPITPSSRILAAYWGPLNIRHIEAKISRHEFLIMDEQFTFAEVEKRFFRDQFDDPRIFFALTSASLSSPPLRNEPYYGRKLSEQLDDQVKRFLSGPLAFIIDREKQRVYLSAMFELSSRGAEFVEKFATDKKFKDHPPPTRAALNFITNYISQKDVSFLEVGNYSVKYMKHDWTINYGS
ncbi:MAG: DUF547 domain-containing protein [Phycisphaerae bacterium]|nr:DUF547 domain-containing protein [Phycisphaerae bacterium]